MPTILKGQILLIVCFLFYLIWWYRGFQPGVTVSRIGGLNGLLLLITAATGIVGIILSLTVPHDITRLRISPVAIIVTGIIGYVVLLFITRFLFHRIVTSELLLIVVWTMLEVYVITILNSSGCLSDGQFWIMTGIITVALLGSMVCYVAYYRMEELTAFYVAMVPLAAAVVSMTTLVMMARM